MPFACLSSDVLREIFKFYPLGDPTSSAPNARNHPPQSDMVTVLSTCRLFFSLVHPLVRWSHWAIGRETDPRTLLIVDRIVRFNKIMFADASSADIAHDRGFMNVTHVEMEFANPPECVVEALKCLRIEHLTVYSPNFLRSVGGDPTVLAYLKCLTIILPVCALSRFVVHVPRTHRPPSDTGRSVHGSSYF